MGNCGNKVKHTCGGAQNFSVCVKYEGALSEHSSLSEEDCLDVQEVIEDIYSITEDIYTKIDMNSLINDCIVFTEPKTLHSVINQMYSELCQLKTLVQSQQTTIATMQQEIDNLQNNVCP